MEQRQTNLFDFLPDDDPNKILFAPQKATDWKWSMNKDYPKEKNGLKVFSCFACGGGQQWDINLPGAKCLAATR